MKYKVIFTIAACVLVPVIAYFLTLLTNETFPGPKQPVDVTTCMIEDCVTSQQHAGIPLRATTISYETGLNCGGEPTGYAKNYDDRCVHVYTDPSYFLLNIIAYTAVLIVGCFVSFHLIFRRAKHGV